MISPLPPNLPTPVPASKNTTTEPALTITVTPGEDNVSSGDKSSNTATINISTAEKEADVTVTREQAVNRLEKNLAREALGNITDGRNNQPGLLKKAAIANAAQNGDIGNGEIQEAAVDIYASRLALDTAQFALDQASSSTDSSTNSNNEPATFSSLANQATSAYVKQTLFFSTVDKVGQKIDEFS